MGNSKIYKPMNFKVRGEYEVKAIKKLLDTLPPVGCIYCSLSVPAKTMGEHPNCVCQCLFLSQRNLLHWRPTDKTWFNRVKWSEEKLKKLTETVSKEAGTKKRYTNGCIRPTNLTGMALTGLTPAQISESFQLQQNYNEQEKYKRLGELMTSEEKRVATSVNTPSGRNALRGMENQFGPLQLRQNEKTKIFDNLKKHMNTDNRKITDSDDNCNQKNVKGKVTGKIAAAPSENQIQLSETEEFVPGRKVFAKIFGFPAWPAKVVGIGLGGQFTVMFQDGQIGVNAEVSEFSEENLVKLAKQNKFKKSGPHSKAAFFSDASSLGLSVKN